MVVLKAVFILFLFGPTIINGKALEYYSAASYQESNPCGTEWDYGTTSNSVPVSCSDTKKSSASPDIPACASKVENEYQPKQNPSYPPPNQPCCELYAKPYIKPYYKLSRQRCSRPLHDPWQESYYQPSVCPAMKKKKKKEEIDPCKLLTNLLQLPLILVEGVLDKDC